MQRFISLTFWRNTGWKIGFLSLLVGLLFAASSVFYVSSTTTLDTRICNHINKLDIALITILERSLATLPVSPYFKQHPDELKGALDATRADIALIVGSGC